MPRSVRVLAREARGRGLPLGHVLFNWDSGWFLIIARHGYDLGTPATSPLHTGRSSLAFFPAYPGAMKFVETVTPLTYVQAGLLVSGVGALLAAGGIHQVAAHLYGPRAGVLAAMLWGVLPVAVVENMAYSESIFTAFAAWALYAALTRRWILAGVFSSLAGLTRANGCAVTAAVGLAALVEICGACRARRTGRAAPVGWWRPLVGGVCLSGAGWLGYVEWVGHRVHDLTGGYLGVQAAWASQFDGGSGTLAQFRTILGSRQALPLETLIVALVLLASVVLFLVTLVQRQPVVLIVYSALILAIAVGDSNYFMCRARFLLPVFTLLLPLAAGLARLRSTATTVVIMTSAAALSALFGGYLLLVWPWWP